MTNGSAYPDLRQSRNFALNPKEGVKIRAFKDAHTPQAATDRELDKLTRYMLHIAPVDDFRILKHKASGKAAVLSYCLIYSSRTGEILQKRLARDNVVAATTFNLLIKIKPIFQNLVFISQYHPVETTCERVTCSSRFSVD